MIHERDLVLGGSVESHHAHQTYYATKSDVGSLQESTTRHVFHMFLNLRHGTSSLDPYNPINP